ncbi:septum formation family protein [Dactylosporangium aurantiacum]|uniref:Septum formation family protein n=1 Tax=Dactylosporangium aurantiacum TaxID=35754 RepID=A0A9Q9MGY2_9ACTN|nr:septum formation family protein [Dactylosporangium aurantiacum]MDG6103378.1 septum formation family protein [Dactylosporangium aurantiacum]UWZ52106.1 septum formation family protein [Dactylosporangium aurantiacum]
MTAVLALLLVTAAGCAQTPKGVDKDLVDDWAMMAAAKVPEPKPGDCWTTQSSQIRDIAATPVSVVQTACEMSHVTETAYVGQFTGSLADADRAPSADAMAETYQDCDKQVTTFLGGAWQDSRLRMVVYPPTTTQWRGGARFYRCDVAALRTERGILDPRTQTLKGALQSGGELMLGCGTQVEIGGNWTDVDPAACTAPHDTEFVGVVTAASSVYPTDAKARSTAWGDRCLNKIRSYTSMPDSALAKAKAGYGYWQIALSQDEWKAGNHSARCYVTLPKKITRSLKGAGNITI